jgi:hypothetical protein
MGLLGVANTVVGVSPETTTYLPTTYLPTKLTFLLLLLLQGPHHS